MKEIDVSIEYYTKGLFDRRKYPLPNNKSILIILVNESDGLNKYLCEYTPMINTSTYMHSGLIGFAKVIYGEYTGIAFNVWEQNESEFIYYKIIEL
jgi:hypothetical protein